MTAFADRWRYTGGDPCCAFFTACLKAARYDIPSGASVLEVGCAEFDWIATLGKSCPDLQVTGIDWRKTRRGIKADVLTHDFPPESFDACVSISTIEHIGLGHYNADPVDVDGDSKALARIWTWLKPGGILFFDVPYNPEGYSVRGTSYRAYDDDAIAERFDLFTDDGPWDRLWVGYAHAKTPGTLIEKPTTATTPFYYVGLVLGRSDGVVRS